LETNKNKKDNIEKKEKIEKEIGGAKIEERICSLKNERI